MANNYAVISTEALIEKFKKALSEGWGYIYGSAGETWTKAKQSDATREQTVKWGSRWIGKRVADCSGLFYWAFKELGSYMYHGSNTMYKKYSTAGGKLKNGLRDDGKELLPGSAVYKYSKDTGYHHVGLYIGNGDVIEAKGTYYGVVTSKVNTWDCWSELVNVDYGSNATVSTEPETETEKKNGACKVVCSKGSVNFRNGPRTSAKVLTTLPAGTQVNVTADDGNWCEVEYTVKGYMMSSYLEQVK